MIKYVFDFSISHNTNSAGFRIPLEDQMQTATGTE